MKPEEITALAREYAEEMAKVTAVDALPNVFKENVIQRNADHFEKHLRWLLRCFCLVEKSKLKTKHKEALAALESNDNEDVKWGTYRLSLLESLFPEIAKEVEV